jgi:hypothetical protein
MKPEPPDFYKKLTGPNSLKALSQNSMVTRRITELAQDVFIAHPDKHPGWCYNVATDMVLYHLWVARELWPDLQKKIEESKR